MPIWRVKPNATDVIDWSFAGTLTLTPAELPWNPMRTIDLVSVRATIRTAAAGAAVIFDIRRVNSSMVDQGSIFPTTGDRPSITAGQFTALYNFVDPLPRHTTTAWFIGKPVQIGSTGTEGAGGVLTLRYRVV